MIFIFLKKQFGSFITSIIIILEHRNNGWWFFSGKNVVYALHVDRTALKLNSQFWRVNIVISSTKDINIVVSHENLVFENGNGYRLNKNKTPSLSEKQGYWCSGHGNLSVQVNAFRILVNYKMDSPVMSIFLT